MKHILAAALAALALAAASAPALAQAPAPRALWEYAETAPLPASLALMAVEPELRFLFPVRAYGPNGGPPLNGNSHDHDREPLVFGEAEQGSLGCIVGGTLASIGAAMIGAENIVNLIAGGIVPAATPVALYASLFGVVFATFCAVGQSMTPALLYAYRRYIEGAVPALALASAPPPALVLRLGE
jgi:hypothetical protein